MFSQNWQMASAERIGKIRFSQAAEVFAKERPGVGGKAAMGAGFPPAFVFARSRQ
jgi:hypothetical protein